MAEVEGRLLRVQVKTSTQTSSTTSGDLRIPVALATMGGNRSWDGVVRRFDPSRFDCLYALTGGGRRWVIPSQAIEATRAITLGGPKYAEFEIEAAPPIDQLVRAPARSFLDWTARPGEYPSGLRMAAVNRPALPSQVRILPPPFTARPEPGG